MEIGQTLSHARVPTYHEEDVKLPQLHVVFCTQLNGTAAMLAPHTLPCILLIAIFFAITPSRLWAQDQEDANTYWYVMAWRVDSFDKLDSLRSQVDRYQSRILEAHRQQNGPVQDEKILFHHTGDAGAFNVLIMQRAASWAALNEGGLATDGVLESAIANEAERQQFRDTQNWIFEGGLHSDHIMMERISQIP